MDMGRRNRCALLETVPNPWHYGPTDSETITRKVSLLMMSNLEITFAPCN
jgi:hypothetical protein